MSDTNDSMSETTYTAPDTPRYNPRAATKRMNAGIGYFFSVLVACAVMMWSVFNTWLNVLMFRADSAATADMESNWTVAAVAVIVTCIIPFLIGLWLLFSTLGKTAKK